MSRTQSVADALAIVRERTAALRADDARLAEREQAHKEDRGVIVSRRRPKHEGFDAWRERFSAVVAATGPSDIAQFVARVGGIENLAWVPNVVNPVQIWPGGHQNPEVSPRIVCWILTLPGIAEAFREAILAQLPPDGPDVLPVGERQEQLAAIDQKLADIARQREAIANELAALNLTSPAPEGGA